MSRILVVGDLHLPADHPDYLDFVKSIRKKYRTTKTIFIGDIVDHHTISFHQKSPEADGPIGEFDKTMSKLKEWKKHFPKAKVCIGNHDERVVRLASDAGIPQMYIRNYSEIYQVPLWEWDYGFTVDDVFYTHGTGMGGLQPSFNAAKARVLSVVTGHHHSIAGINWLVGPSARIFGMNVGSGVDKNHIAMQYGKNMIKKPILSCGVVIDGHPYLELMNL
tara:strand:+ start:262 stop:921 length:660 start_codon:yes stop_codon:yes gene_type:complete